MAEDMIGAIVEVTVEAGGTAEPYPKSVVEALVQLKEAVAALEAAVAGHPQDG